MKIIDKIKNSVEVSINLKIYYTNSNITLAHMILEIIKNEKKSSEKLLDL